MNRHVGERDKDGEERGKYEGVRSECREMERLIQGLQGMEW